MAAALMGGSLLSTCQTRVRQGLIDASKDQFFSLLDPAAIVALLIDDVDGSTESP